MISSLRLRTALRPRSTVEFVHTDWGSVSVEEPTYFGIESNLSANSPSRDGQA